MFNPRPRNDDALVHESHLKLGVSRSEVVNLNLLHLQGFLEGGNSLCILDRGPIPHDVVDVGNAIVYRRTRFDVGPKHRETFL